MENSNILQLLLIAAVVLFPISEIALAVVKRSKVPASGDLDRGSMRRLWLSIGLGIFLAVLCGGIRATLIPAPRPLLQSLSLVLLAGGLALRWIAILTLGRFFTVNVAIQERHTLLQSGVYRHVRHPSYTGLLLAFLGLGLFFANWLSLAFLLVPVTLAVLNRVAKEEQALRAAFGDEYAVYCARTKRFLPGLV